MDRLKPILLPLFATLTVAILIIAFAPASAASATSGLPPRPTPDPLPSSSHSSGAKIVLQAQPADFAQIDQQSWAVVQWQDRSGHWHDVEGWQGTFTFEKTSNRWEVVWWVDGANFGEKSFRWRVYADQARTKRLGTSDLFDLPTHEQQDVFVALR